MEDLAYLLGAVVGDFNTNMRLMHREGCTESFLLTLREPITQGAQEIADLIEGIPLTSTVAQCVLLDTAAYLTWGVASEFDDMKGVQHAGCILGAGHQWRSPRTQPACSWDGQSLVIEAGENCPSDARGEALPVVVLAPRA